MRSFPRSFTFTSLLVWSLASLTAGCDGDTEEEQPTEWTDPEGVDVTWTPARPDALEWTFKDTTTYIKAPDSDLVVVAESSLTVPLAGFEDLLDLAPGDVLIGNAHSQLSDTNPEGFLRKVVSVTESGEQIVISTESASLADAFEECDMVATWDLPSFGDLVFVDESDGSMLSPESFGESDGLDPIPQVSFDVGGTVLFDANGLKATVTKGSFEFTPAFHFELDASITKGLKKFSAVATGNHTSELEVRLETTQGVEKDFNKTFSAGPIIIPVGPLNAKVIPRLVLGCSVDIPSGISFTDGVRAQSSVAIGAEFEKGEGLSGIAQSSFTLTRLGPTLNAPEAAVARCFIRPELELTLSAILANAGAKLGVEGFAEATAALSNNVCKLDFEAGVTGTVDVDLTALGFEVVDQQLTLFERNAQLLNDAPCVPKKTNL